MPSYVNLNVINNVSNSTNPATGNSYIADLVGAVRNGFLSCSFTRTVQSGSINDLNTLPSITGQAQAITYDIFAFNDGLQATHPLFIKVEYRTSFEVNSLGLSIEMGSAHNNSGSIISTDKIVGGHSTYSNGGAGTPGVDKIYASGDGSYITMTSLVNTANSCQVIVCERFYDQYGQPTGSGFHMISTRSGNVIGGTNIYLVQQATKYGEAPPTSEIYNVVHSRPGRVPSIYGGNLILGLVYPFLGKPMNPSPNILFGESTTFPTTYSTIDYTVYGQQYTYINTGGTLSVDQRISSNGRWLVRI